MSTQTTAPNQPITLSLTKRQIATLRSLLESAIHDIDEKHSFASDPEQYWAEDEREGAKESLREIADALRASLDAGKVEIVSIVTEHREAQPERPYPFSDLGLVGPNTPAMPAHDVKVVTVRGFGRERNTDHLHTLEYPAELSIAQIMQRVGDSHRADLAQYAAGD